MLKWMKKTPPPTRGVPVELGGHTRYLRYPLRVMRQVREEFGTEAMNEGLDVEQLSVLICYGLRHEDDAITVKQVEEWVDGQNLKEVTEAMLEAFGQDPRAAAFMGAMGAAGPATPPPDPEKKT